MTTLLSRLERMVAAVELPAGYEAYCGWYPQEDLYEVAVSHMPEWPAKCADRHQVVKGDDFAVMTDDDVRNLVLELVAQLDDGDAPVPQVVA